MTDRKSEIKNEIVELLSSTGEHERLCEYVETKLSEIGWNEKVKSACKDYIRSKGVDNIKVEEVIEAITPIARHSIPVELKEDVLEMMRQFLIQHDIDM